MTALSQERDPILSYAGALIEIAHKVQAPVEAGDEVAIGGLHIMLIPSDETPELPDWLAFFTMGAKVNGEWREDDHLGDLEVAYGLNAKGQVVNVRLEEGDFRMDDPYEAGLHADWLLVLQTAVGMIVEDAGGHQPRLQ